MPHFGELQPCYKRWLHTPILSCSFASNTFAVANRVYLGQLIVPNTLEIDRISYRVGAVSAGNVRLGIYREGPTPERPDGGALVVETGSVAQAAVSSLQMITIPATLLRRGKYWLAIQGDDVTGTYYMNRDDAGIIGCRYIQVYGPFTDPCPATALDARPAHMFVRVSMPGV